MTRAQIDERLKVIEAEIKAIRLGVLKLAAEKRLLDAVRALRGDCERRNGAEP